MAATTPGGAAWRAGGLVALLLALIVLLAPAAVVALREGAFDRMLAGRAGAPSGAVAVVAIDSAALQALGPWPWPRARLAALVGQIAAAGPRAIGIDIVLSGPDRHGAEGLARMLGGLATPEALAALGGLPDGDAALAAALTGRPVVLAAALSATAGSLPAPVPILLSGAAPALHPVRAPGAEGPLAALAAVAAVAPASLQGEHGGIVRRAPLLLDLGGTARPGLAVEVLRLAEGAGTLRLVDGALGIGAVDVVLPPDAALRIAPSDPARWADRTQSAAALVPEALAGRIVLLGLTAPEAASLRPTAVGPLVPSVQIQADAVETLLADQPPRRAAVAAEGVGALALTLAAIALAARAAPGVAVAGALLMAALWAGGAVLAFRQAAWLVDPVGPALAPLACGLAATLAALASARLRAAALRRRFERHLAPGVVARIARDPEAARLRPEMREITALFTDLEGFTAAAARLPPAQLIGILDAYFAGVTAIVHRHGGMVDKFVGDAAHCLFNAPFDLPDHADRALACAVALRAFGAAFAQDPRHGGLGQTRVGVETGVAVVGDVGSGEKLDYTAHGAAVNLAARLEQAASGLGGVLAGPGAVAAAPGCGWVAAGEVAAKGVGRVMVWRPS